MTGDDDGRRTRDVEGHAYDGPFLSNGKEPRGGGERGKRERKERKQSRNRVGSGKSRHFANSIESFVPENERPNPVR